MIRSRQGHEPSHAPREGTGCTSSLRKLKGLRVETRNRVERTHRHLEGTHRHLEECAESKMFQISPEHLGICFKSKRVFSNSAQVQYGTSYHNMQNREVNLSVHLLAELTTYV